MAGCAAVICPCFRELSGRQGIVLRPTVANFLASRGPGLLGLCQSDVTGACSLINAAVERLIYAPEVGDAGWIGSWAEIAFELTQEDPFLTTPFDVARIMSLDVCTNPVPVRNQMFEYLLYGFGRLPKSNCQARNRCAPIAAYERGVFPTFSDIVPPDKIVRVYLSDSGDEGKQVLLQTKDANDQIRYSLNGAIQVIGDVLTLVPPFVDSPAVVSKVIGVQKDVTLGPVNFYEVDTVTGDQRLILTMQPSETTAAYRRYYVSGLPRSCCNLPDGSTTVQVTALCQLTFVPVTTPTSWLLIPNIEALIHECQAIRYDGIDEPAAKQMSLLHHRSAIRLLNGQSIHEAGKESPSVAFSPFGSAHLACARVGTVI